MPPASLIQDCLGHARQETLCQEAVLRERVLRVRVHCDVLLATAVFTHQIRFGSCRERAYH